MKPYHWPSHHGNFGDDLNLWLWDALLPGLREVREETLLVGVGTVLNPTLLPSAVHKLVIGSGYGYVPAVLPFLGLAWLWHAGRRDQRNADSPVSA